MSKRKILSLAKKKNLKIKTLDYYWTSSPGESYPEWELIFDEETAKLL